MSENGYNVWLGNARGSDHSLTHRRLGEYSKDFWDFSFHEIGIFDLPAMLDLVLKESQTPRLYFIGQGQGAASVMALLSVRPEFNQKIIQVHALAPAIIMENFSHPVMKLVMEYLEVRNIDDLLASDN